ncbi:MAG TPA: hypothetical protein VMU07_02020 [Candidatus Paceibacterota bacterium]|nr:hypothetical protein [Candidatus Paceibacterota bacterium]
MESNGSATILRWGLAFVFFYAAIAALLDPGEWGAFLPPSLSAVAPLSFFLTVFSVYELILAVWLFWGKHLWWSSLLATITLAGVAVANYQAMDIAFRDIGLAFAALALFQAARHNS